MKRVYIAGAYSGPDVLTVFKNMRHGIKHSAMVFESGFSVFSPWLDWPLHMQMDFQLEDCYNSSLAWLEVSDAVFLVPGWEDSNGTKKEIKRAKELGIPVFETMGALKSYFG